MTDRPIIVTRHAVIRANDRGIARGAAFTPDTIAAEVRDAIAAGRIASHKPAWCRLWKKRTLAIPDGQRCVWDATETFAWIIAREPGHDVVVTTITRTQAEAAA